MKGGTAQEFMHGMRDFSDLIATVFNSLLIAIVYILGIGSAAVASRLAGKSFLKIRMMYTKDTYWESLGLSSKREEKDYLRQF